MKRKLLQAALLLGMLTGNIQQAMADEFKFLTVVVDGVNTMYDVNSIESITFDANNMFLNMSTGSTVTVPFATMTKMVIGDPAGINALTNDASGLQLSDGTLTVDMLAAGSLSVYDTAGKTILQAPLKAGRNTIALTGIGKGVYIVKVNGTTRKVINR